MNHSQNSAFPGSSKNSHHGNVVLNFQNLARREYGVYGDAFHRAGRTLVEDLAERNGYSDLEACPIVFLYRQALELLMKGAILIGNDLVESSGKSPLVTSDSLNTHRLSQLVPALARSFESVGWKWDLDIEGIKNKRDFRKFLEDLETVDPLSFSFRYPVDRKGKATVPKGFHFNVMEFSTKLDKILDLLYGATTGLEEIWQSTIEALHEL